MPRSIENDVWGSRKKKIERHTIVKPIHKTCLERAIKVGNFVNARKSDVI